MAKLCTSGSRLCQHQDGPTKPSQLRRYFVSHLIEKKYSRNAQSSPWMKLRTKHSPFIPIALVDLTQERSIQRFGLDGHENSFDGDQIGKDLLVWPVSRLGLNMQEFSSHSPF